MPASARSTSPLSATTTLAPPRPATRPDDEDGQSATGASCTRSSARRSRLASGRVRTVTSRYACSPYERELDYRKDDFSVTNGPGPDPERRLESSRNVFAEVFGQQSPEEWIDTLVASLRCTSIAGVDFPTFPPAEFQNALHGHSGEGSLREVLTFYNFVVRHSLAVPEVARVRPGLHAGFRGRLGAYHAPLHA